MCKEIKKIIDTGLYLIVRIKSFYYLPARKGNKLNSKKLKTQLYR